MWSNVRLTRSYTTFKGSMRGKFVAYYRVSTARQGRSGLGLEAQRSAVLTYLNGGRWTLVEEFTEVESGKKTDKQRPELAKALAACRVYGATLVIAKLDRLSRNATFLLTLRDSGAEFVAADMPDANRLTVGIMALVAENTREAISANTKAALAAAKRRGVKLGNPGNATSRGRRRGQIASAEVRAANAAQLARDIAPVLHELRGAGIMSTRRIAEALNSREVQTPRKGGKWTAMQVSRLLKQVAAAESAKG